jgi:hypothetical protein
MESTHAQDETKKAGRPKGPIDTEYHVLRLEGTSSFEHLTNDGALKAKSKKQALEAVGAALDGSESFLLIKGKDFSILTPRTEEETIKRTKFVL